MITPALISAITGLITSLLGAGTGSSTTGTG